MLHFQTKKKGDARRPISQQNTPLPFFPNCIIRGKREMAGSTEKNGIDFSTSLTSLTFDLDTERERVRAIKSYEAA